MWNALLKSDEIKVLQNMFFNYKAKLFRPSKHIQRFSISEYNRSEFRFLDQNIQDPVSGSGWLTSYREIFNM